jgi:hypothetical protein
MGVAKRRRGRRITKTSRTIRHVGERRYKNVNEQKRK